MKTATVKEMESNISQYLKEIDKEDVLIVSNGKPEAILHRLVGDDLEDYIIANSPAIRGDIEKAYKEYQDEGGIDLSDLLDKRGR